MISRNAQYTTNLERKDSKVVAPLPAQELDPARSRVSAAASLGAEAEARRILLHLACLEVEGVSRRRTL